MEKKIKELTDPFIKAMPKPEKRIEIPDGAKPGLFLRVTPSGHKSFVYRYRSGSEIKRYTIGSYSNVSLSDARKEVKRIHRDLKMGIDPIVQKNRITQKQLTFRELAELFQKEHFKKLKESTRRDYKSRINKHLVPEFGRMAIEDIQRGHIKRFLMPFAEDQPSHANRMQSILSKIFSFAVNEEFTNNHPLKKMPKFGNEIKRERWYNKEEVKALWKAFEERPQPLQSLLKVLLLTGQRLGETSRMKWEDIDTGRAIWIIPESETKAGRMHAVPVAGGFKDILEALHPLTGHTDYVFASPFDNSKPLTYFKPAMEDIRKCEEAPKDFRIHDLRRTAATYMAEIGTDRTTLGKLLNHKGLAGDSHVTSIYDRHDYMEEKRRALIRWDSYLQQIITGEKSKSKVFKIG